MLVIFAGLPGVGKSTVSKALAARTGALYLRIDSIERAMGATDDAGYRVGYAIAGDNLRLGRTVIADSVNPVEASRAAWRAVAERSGCAAVEIEVICSDEAEHRRRVERRAAAFPGEGWPDWQAVVDREYHPWTRDRLVVDTALGSTASAVDDIVLRLEAERCLADPDSTP